MNEILEETENSEGRPPTGKLLSMPFEDWCRMKGMKCTNQRKAVFVALQDAFGHPSVDQIFQIVKEKVKTVTRESVYRILNEFTAHGLLSRLDALTSARYDKSISPHTHFICEECGQLFDFPFPILELPSRLPDVIHHMELRITGLCAACQEKRTAENLIS